MRLVKRAIDTVPIDIAPMIDCVFQLLIFFLLTSSYVIYPGIRVSLPKATSGKESSASLLVLTLTKDHLLYWHEEPVTLSTLRERLRQAGSGKPILIRADRHAYVDKLVEIWDACREAGSSEVHIATMTE